MDRGSARLGYMDKVANKNQPDPALGGTYFLGIVGSAVYFVEQVSGFWPVALAVLKAFVWPAFAVYYLFKFLNA